MEKTRHGLLSFVFSTLETESLQEKNNNKEAELGKPKEENDSCSETGSSKDVFSLPRKSHRKRKKEKQTQKVPPREKKHEMMDENEEPLSLRPASLWGWLLRYLRVRTPQDKQKPDRPSPILMCTYTTSRKRANGGAAHGTSCCLSPLPLLCRSEDLP